MLSTLMAHHAAPPNDREIDLRLHPRETGRLPADPAIRVGIETPEGRLYRVFSTTSVVEAVHLFETLQDLGYRPVRPAGAQARVTRVYRDPGHR